MRVPTRSGTGSITSCGDHSCRSRQRRAGPPLPHVGFISINLLNVTSLSFGGLPHGHPAATCRSEGRRVRCVRSPVSTRCSDSSCRPTRYGAGRSGRGRGAGRPARTGLRRRRRPAELRQHLAEPPRLPSRGRPHRGQPRLHHRAGRSDRATARGARGRHQRARSSIRWAPTRTCCSRRGRSPGWPRRVSLG